MSNNETFSDYFAGATAAADDVGVNALGLLPGGGTVWDQPSSSGVSVEIGIRRSDHRIAPEGVFFHLTLAGFDTNTASSAEDYDPSYHDKVCFWDYGESYEYSAPTQVLAMDAADGGNRSNSRYSRGPLGSHVYRIPGAYTARCAVLEPASGKWGQASIPISVGDPNTFYAGNRTFFVDLTANFINAPAGARHFTDITDAFAALNAAMTPHRIVLERAQVHKINRTLQFRPPPNANAVSLRVESTGGTGSHPIIQAGNRFAGTSLILDRSLMDAKEIDTGTVLKGLKLRGTWDVATETGAWDIDGVNFGNARANHCLVDDCEIKNINVGFRTINLESPLRNNRVYFLNDSVISDWSNYGILEADHGYTSVLGSRVAQNPDAIAGGPKDRAHNNHGPYRAGAPNKTVFISSDFFSATGWSSVGSIRAIQPAIRWNTSPELNSGAQLNMQCCAVESAGVPIVLSAANKRQNSRLVNAVIEGSIAVGGFNTTRLIGLTHGGLTLRNNVLVFPGTQYNAKSIGGLSRGPGAFITTATNGDGNGTDTANLAAPIRIYNNTLVNLANTRSAPIWEDAIMGFSSVIVDNNLVHEPNLSRPNTPFAPLMAVPAITPRYMGYRASVSILYTQFATPAESGSIWIPQIGSSALGAALTGLESNTDFRGDLRPEPPSIGAFEAS